jgi:hypothetical protein
MQHLSKNKKTFSKTEGFYYRVVEYILPIAESETNVVWLNVQASFKYCLRAI